MPYDIDNILQANPIDSVVSSRLELKKHGHRYDGLCPFHTEKTPSFQVYSEKGYYVCRGCDAHGDVIDFIMQYDGVDFKEACKILGGESKPPDPKGRTKRVKKVVKSIYDGIEPIMPVPSKAELLTAGKRTPEIWNPNREKMTVYKPSAVYEYRNAEGMLVAYVLRIDFEDGKITPCIMWCEWREQEGATEGWCHYSLPEPRPLYGLDGLHRNPDAPVLVVEGEKAADAAHKLLPAYAVVTWAGGTQVIKLTDWGPLQGRRLTLWPDADEVGVEAMEKVAAKAMDAGAGEVRVVDVMREQ